MVFCARVVVCRHHCSKILVCESAVRNAQVSLALGLDRFHDEHLAQYPAGQRRVPNQSFIIQGLFKTTELVHPSTATHAQKIASYVVVVADSSERASCH